METVDAEITVIMLVQRACDDENQAEHRLSNGPRRAQSKAIAKSRAANTVLHSAGHEAEYSVT